ncbi:MAG: EamA family transporter [Pseudonocardiaceae bacterium]|nr:EamA family transporter [Pseudonocardiaceae bacterium]
MATQPAPVHRSAREVRLHCVAPAPKSAVAGNRPDRSVGPVTANPPRRRLLESSAGTRIDAFGPAEWGLLIAVATLWGSSFLFIDLGLAAFEPGVIAMVRLSLGAGTLILLARARRRIAREDLPRVAVLGIVWMGIPMLLFPVAQQWVDSAVAGMINGAMPLTTAAWSVLLLRRAPGRIHLAGLAVGFAGIGAISCPVWWDRGPPRWVPACWCWRWCSTAWPRASPYRCSSATAPCRCCCVPSWSRWSS